MNVVTTLLRERNNQVSSQEQTVSENIDFIAGIIDPQIRSNTTQCERRLAVLRTLVVLAEDSTEGNNDNLPSSSPRIRRHSTEISPNNINVGSSNTLRHTNRGRNSRLRNESSTHPRQRRLSDASSGISRERWESRSSTYPRQRRLSDASSQFNRERNSRQETKSSTQARQRHGASRNPNRNSSNNHFNNRPTTSQRSKSYGGLSPAQYNHVIRAAGHATADAYHKMSTGAYYAKQKIKPAWNSSPYLLQ